MAVLDMVIFCFISEVCGGSREGRSLGHVAVL
jgi:hypothetical protein